VNKNLLAILSGIVATIILSIGLAVGDPAPTTQGSSGQASSGQAGSGNGSLLKTDNSKPTTKPAVADGPSPFGTTRPTLAANERKLRRLSAQAIDEMESNQFDKARVTLTKALEIDPAEPENLYNMACLDARTGKADEALVFLKKSAEAGFDDFSHIAVDTDLTTLHDRPEFKQILAEKSKYQHVAAQKAVEALKKNFGPNYICEIDDQDKFIFATNTDQATLDALKKMLVSQARSQWKTLFEHHPEGYIAIVIPSAKDYEKLRPNKNVLGFYNPATHTLIASGLGFVTTHEFTHAMHFGDVEAIDQQHPIWLVEGIAVLFERTEYKGDILTPETNDRIYELQYLQKQKKLIPLAKLIAMKQPEFISSKNVGAGYAESGAVIKYLYDRNLLRPFYDAVKADYDKDPTGKMALEEVTKEKLPDFEKDWNAWIKKQVPPPMFTGVKGAFIGAKFSNENDGLLISDIIKDSPAAKAGMKDGDVVSGLNGTDVRDHESFLPMLATHKPGETITLTVRRGKEYLDVPIVLGERPASTLPPGFHPPGEEPAPLPTTKPTEKDPTTKPVAGK
jgi:hypothetical protein